MSLLLPTLVTRFTDSLPLGLDTCPWRVKLETVTPNKILVTPLPVLETDTLVEKPSTEFVVVLLTHRREVSS